LEFPFHDYFPSLAEDCFFHLGYAGFIELDLDILVDAHDNGGFLDAHHGPVNAGAGHDFVVFRKLAEHLLVFFLFLPLRAQNDKIENAHDQNDLEHEEHGAGRCCLWRHILTPSPQR
jgi:hypothetical protein